MKTNVKFGALFISAIFILAITTTGIAGAQNTMKEATDTAVVDKAIADYLSGKTDKFYVPGAILDTEKREISLVPSYPEVPAPNLNGPISISNNQVTPLGTGSQLPIFPTPDAHWSNTYMVFGANGHYPNSVDGRINCINTLQDTSSGRYDEFAMHYYGWNTNKNIIAENCIQMLRTGSTATFNIIVNFTVVESWTSPAGDTYTMFIKANNPSGRNFNSIEFSIYDINSGRYYDRIKQSPCNQQMHLADIALEKYYYHDGSDNELPPTSIVWKSISNFHIYDYNLQRVDLLNNGYVSEFVTSGVANYDYADFYDYFGTSNAEAEMYMTRYNPINSPPQHP